MDLAAVLVHKDIPGCAQMDEHILAYLLFDYFDRLLASFLKVELKPEKIRPLIPKINVSE